MPVLLGRSQPVALKQERRFAFPAAMGIALVTAVLAGTFATAGYSYEAAKVAVVAGDDDAAWTLATRAITLDPLNSQYRTMIPSGDNIARALELDPKREELWRFVAQLSEQKEDIPSALAAYQMALQLRPMSVSHYENVARLLDQQMTTALDQGKTEQATAIAQELVALGQAVEQQGSPSLERQKEAFRGYPPLTMTAPLNLTIGKADLVAGNREAAEVKLTAALSNKDLATDAALWLHALYARTGNDEALAALKAQPSERILRSSMYESLLQLP